MIEIKVRSAEFRAEREAGWHELEALVLRVERRGPQALATSEVRRLGLLYRHAISSLSIARAISLDVNLVGWLETLCSRAWRCVYGTRRSALAVMIELVSGRFAAIVRRFGAPVGLAALVFAAGCVVGGHLTWRDPELFDSFVPSGLAAGRGPLASTEALRSALYAHAEGDMQFAVMLFLHNSMIALLCFAFGVAAGIPTIALLFLNGLTMGAFWAVYASHGIGAEFLAWIAPHGFTEIGALIICAGMGLVLGKSVVFPGVHRRLENLAINGREAGMAAAGAALMLLIAGLLEGIARQEIVSPAARLGVGLATLVFWSVYFGRAGGKAMS